MKVALHLMHTTRIIPSCSFQQPRSFHGGGIVSITPPLQKLCVFQSYPNQLLKSPSYSSNPSNRMEFSTTKTETKDIGSYLEQYKMTNLRELAQAGMIPSALIIDDKGGKTETVLTKAELLKEVKMQPRELRVISKVAQNLVRIIVKSNGFIIHMLDIKVIIQDNRVLVFDHNNPNVQPLLKELTNQIEIFLSDKSNDERFAFEFRAFEAVLMSVTTSLETVFEDLRISIEDTLKTIMKSPERQYTLTSEFLLKSRKDLSEFQTKVVALHLELQQLWQSDEDMAAMYLTAKSNGYPRSVDQHQEMEDLLESYLGQLEFLMGEIKQLQEAIHATDEHLNVHLASSRNKLMKTQLTLSTATLVISVSSAVAAIFGMNLYSSFETDPHAFWYVTGGILATNGVLFVGLFSLMRKLRLL
eukprot:TRINITY_DN8047_c0_g1_i1.p1 TRINITY_DN8047_c0_g1~~TRINITY_DN8047_c0_g1_i1.p1  ORF type:complete len:415 (-),score=59.85 TRINITY_DN8047_c0_g1_i1:11-1255(-)